jgi:hypothetical protein
MTTPTITAAEAAQNTLFTAAKTHASQHRAEVESSGRCACFFCFRTFPPVAIKAWTDKDQTALCPHCGVDSVLGSESGHRLDEGFLRKMHQHYFAQRSR